MPTRRPILVIEDSDHDFAILEMCLESAGVENPVHRCAGAEEITAYLSKVELARVNSAADLTELPVFIFLDLNLPGIHGSEVLKRLKHNKALAPIPAVVLTTSTQSRDVEMSYELGAAGFLTKPLDLNKFEDMIQRVADYWFSCVKLPEIAGIG